MRSHYFYSFIFYVLFCSSAFSSSSTELTPLVIPDSACLEGLSYSPCSYPVINPIFYKPDEISCLLKSFSKFKLSDHYKWPVYGAAGGLEVSNIIGTAVMAYSGQLNGVFEIGASLFTAPAVVGSVYVSALLVHHLEQGFRQSTVCNLVFFPALSLGYLEDLYLRKMDINPRISGMIFSLYLEVSSSKSSFSLAADHNKIEWLDWDLALENFEPRKNLQIEMSEKERAINGFAWNYSKIRTDINTWEQYLDSGITRSKSIYQGLDSLESSDPEGLKRSLEAEYFAYHEIDKDQMLAELSLLASSLYDSFRLALKDWADTEGVRLGETNKAHFDKTNEIIKKIKLGVPLVSREDSITYLQK